MASNGTTTEEFGMDLEGRGCGLIEVLGKPMKNLSEQPVHRPKIKRP
jgi:hypothetical protein